MGLSCFLKDLVIFIAVIPVAILFLLTTFLFSIWKRCISLLVKICYRNGQVEFLSPLDLYFVSLEGTFNFYRQPRKVLGISVLLNGEFGEDELKAKFQQEVIDFRDERGQVVYKRLQQKLVKKLGYMFFTKDTHFHIDNHIRTVKIPLNEKSALDFVKTTTCAPFHPDSSMWEFILVPNYNGENKTLLFFRVHHTFMDGFSLLSIFRKGCEGGGNVVPGRSIAPPAPPPAVSLRVKMAAFYRNTIGLPGNYIREQRSRRNLTPKFITKDFFLEKTPRIPLSHFKGLKAESDVSFTLAITTAVSAALSNATSRKAVPLADLDYITAIITVPTFVEAGEVGNSFILADLNIPLQPMTLDARIQKCREEMMKTRQAVSPRVIGLMARLGSAFPSALFLKCFVPSMSEEEGILVTNMPGPAATCTFWGRRVLDMSYSVIACENPWLGVSIFSYDGSVRIGLTGIAHVFETKAEFETFRDNFLKTLDNMFNKIIA